MTTTEKHIAVVCNNEHEFYLAREAVEFHGGKAEISGDWRPGMPMLVYNRDTNTWFRCSDSDFKRRKYNGATMANFLDELKPKRAWTNLGKATDKYRDMIFSAVGWTKARPIRFARHSPGGFNWSSGRDFSVMGLYPDNQEVSPKLFAIWFAGEKPELPEPCKTPFRVDDTVRITHCCQDELDPDVGYDPDMDKCSGKIGKVTQVRPEKRWAWVEVKFDGHRRTWTWPFDCLELESPVPEMKVEFTRPLAEMKITNSEPVSELEETMEPVIHYRVHSRERWAELASLCSEQGIPPRSSYSREYDSARPFFCIEENNGSYEFCRSSLRGVLAGSSRYHGPEKFRKKIQTLGTPATEPEANLIVNSNSEGRDEMKTFTDEQINELAAALKARSRPFGPGTVTRKVATTFWKFTAWPRLAGKVVTGLAAAATWDVLKIAGKTAAGGALIYALWYTVSQKINWSAVSEMFERLWI